MATILERFQALGLAHSKPVLSAVGNHVSTIFCNKNLYGRALTRQVEDGVEITVWTYPDSWTPELDKIILDYIEYPRKDS